MKKLVVALAVLLVGAGAYAAESQSEFFYQAAAGEHVGTAGLGVVVNGTSESTPDDADITGTLLSVGYEYGINEAWAIGATLGYTQLKMDDNGTDTDIKGMDNLLVDLKGKHAGVEGLRYGAQLDLALEKGEVKAGEVNSADGGISIAPYVGFEWMKGSCAYGGKLSYEVGIQDRETESAGTTTEEGGGHDTTLAGFFEHTMNDKWALGGSVAYAMTSDSEPEVGADVDEGTTTTVRIYAPISAVGPGTLIPDIQHEMTSADNADSTITAVGVNYRMVF